MTHHAQQNNNDRGLDFLEATGPVPISMTNDYLFKILLQNNEIVLRGLICSLLHLAPEQINSVVILNPIMPGDTIDDKAVILDVSVLLNDNTRIDLEMQVVNELNWPERALYYACKNYLNLERGEEYLDVMPSVQIGFLDFTLFEENPSFYATYRLEDTKTHHLFTDKLTRGVVDLSRIDLASDEDRRYNIDKWARLFKAKTWEELKMLASEDKAIQEAVKTVYQVSEDERQRFIAFGREDAIRRQNGIMKRMDRLQDELTSTQEELAEKDRIIEQLRAQFSEKDRIIEQLRAQLAEKES